MSLVYDESPAKRGGRMNFDTAPATRIYLQHYQNFQMLQFIANSPLAKFEDRMQATKELRIAERKMEYWHRHPNFNQQAATDACVAILRDWK